MGEIYQDGSGKSRLNPEPETVKSIAKELAYDTVFYVTKHRSTLVKPSKSKYAVTLRRTVDELSSKHEILFKGMVNKLQVSESNAQATIDNIANEMLGDRQFNWGRLVTLYAFTALLAKHCSVNCDKKTIVEEIATYTGKYIAEHLSGYITQNGGWEAFADYFPEPTQTENTIWKGLLYTVVGLGALATMVSAR